MDEKYWVKDFKGFLKYVLNDGKEKGSGYDDEEIYKIIICVLLFFNERNFNGENILKEDAKGYEMIKDKAMDIGFEKYKNYFIKGEMI